MIGYESTIVELIRETMSVISDPVGIITVLYTDNGDEFKTMSSHIVAPLFILFKSSSNFNT